MSDLCASSGPICWHVLELERISDRIGSSTQHGLNGKLQLGDYRNARVRSKIGRFRLDYAAKNIAFAPAILSVASKIHPEFLRLLWVLADMQTVKYFNLVGDEEDIGNERFKWSRARTFSYNRNAIGLAVAYASAIRTHLSVHGTAHPMSAASVHPRSAADCLIRSAVDISHPRQQGKSSCNLLPVVLSTTTLSMALVQVQSGGVAILRWFLACLQALFTVMLTLLLLHFSLHSPPSHCLSFSFCCCSGAHFRSRSFHYHNHLFPLLVVVL